ncbi:MAG: hypothetical protein ABSG79_04260 [Bryobacteraceae bacterium]
MRGASPRGVHQRPHGSAFTTTHRQLKHKKPGGLWFAPARMAIERGAPSDGEDVDLEELIFEGPIQ